MHGPDSAGRDLRCGLLLGPGDRSCRPGGDRRAGRRTSFPVQPRRGRQFLDLGEQNLVDFQKRTRLADRLADERRIETPGDDHPLGGSQRRPGTQRRTDRLRRRPCTAGDRHAGCFPHRADAHAGRPDRRHARIRILGPRSGHILGLRQRRMDGSSRRARLGRGIAALGRTQKEDDDHRNPFGQRRRRPPGHDHVPGRRDGARGGDRPSDRLPRRSAAHGNGLRQEQHDRVPRGAGSPCRPANPLQPQLDRREGGTRLAHRHARIGHLLADPGRHHADGFEEHRQSPHRHPDHPPRRSGAGRCGDHRFAEGQEPRTAGLVDPHRRSAEKVQRRRLDQRRQNDSRQTRRHDRLRPMEQGQRSPRLHS